MQKPNCALPPERRRCRPGSRGRAGRAIGIAAGLLLATAPVALAGMGAGMGGVQPTADEEWRKTLRQQLTDQYGCQLEHFVFERETPIDGKNVREGRIRCLDGREIDYSQSSILLRFELRLCSPTVC